MDAIENLSYEVAYQQLETIIEQLESGELSLEKSVDLYEQGQLLSAHCQKLLEDAELKIKQVDDTGEIR
jgi:exodeoxyribonuclease VII small subunit